MSEPTAAANLTIETLENAKKLLDKRISPEDTTVSQQDTNPEEKPLTEDEASAYFVHQAHQDFKRLAYQLAERMKRAPARVLEAVLFEPLEEVELISKAESELFDLAQQVMYHKGIILRKATELADEKHKKGLVK